MNACLPGFVAGLADGLDDHVERLGIALQIGGEAAFVADVRGELLGLEHLLEVVKHLAAAADGVAETLDAQRHDHELLHVDGVVGVRAAVDDVHHRGRQQPGADAAQVAEQRQPAVVGRGMGVGQRHAQNGVGAQVLLVLGAVELDHAVVERDLIDGVHAAQFVGQLGVDVVDGLENPLAEILRLVAVAELQGLVDAGAGPAGDGGAAERAVGQFHVDLDGGIAAAIENLSGANVYNR